MRLFGKLAVAFGLVCLSASPVWAQGRGGGGMMGGGAQLLTNKSVQEELKVSEDQTSKLTAFADEMRTKQREAFQGLQDLSDDERRTKMQELGRSMQEDINKGLAGILKPEQTKRFHQIQFQQAGVQAFSQPKVAGELKLTDDQKQKMQGLSQEMMGQMREIFQEAQGDREAAMAKMTTLRKETQEKAAALLTDDQKKSWKEMQGSPFEIKMERRPN